MPNTATDHVIPAEWAVFALPSKSKEPQGGHAYKDAIKGALIAKYLNYGIATGWASGFWVLDLDVLGLDILDAIALVEKLLGVKIPDIFTVKSRSGGWHFYFKTREDARIPRRLSFQDLPIDICGEGGYVVGPGSYVEKAPKPSGFYEVALDTEIAETPDDLLALVTKEAEPETEPVVVDLSTAVVNLQDGRLLMHLERIRSAVDHSKYTNLNNGCFGIGGLVGAGIVPLEHAQSMIKEAMEHNQAREKASDGGMLNKGARITATKALSQGMRKPTPPTEMLDVNALFDDLAYVSGRPSTTTAGQQPESDKAPRAVDPALATPIDDFWGSTPVLQHIHDFSKSAMAGPWSVLGHALARASMLIPVQQLIPAFVGSPAPINLCMAQVGVSGGSKSVGAGVAKRMFRHEDWANVDKRPVGSGEGIVEAFLVTEKQPDPFDLDGKRLITVRRVKDDPAILFEAGEIDALAAMGGRRQGSTLMPTIRQMFSGSMLGQTNATEERTRLVPEGTYRASLTVDVQPANSEALLGENERSGGTAQRFLWMFAGDREMDADFPVVDPMVMRFPNLGGGEVIFAPGIRDFVRYTKEDEGRGRVKDLDPLDAHAMLIREKVAACLALLHDQVDPSEPSRLFVSLDMWALAGSVMEHSSGVRETCLEVLAATARQRAESEDLRKAKVRVDAASMIRGDEHKAQETAIEKALETAAAKVRAQGVMKSGVIWNNLNANAKKATTSEDFLEGLEEKGLVVHEHSTGKRGRPAIYVAINQDVLDKHLAQVG